MKTSYFLTRERRNKAKHFYELPYLIMIACRNVKLMDSLCFDFFSSYNMFFFLCCVRSNVKSPDVLEGFLDNLTKSSRNYDREKSPIDFINVV